MTLISPLVDFQRDFVEDGGFGEIQGGNLAAVQAAVKPAAALLKIARRAGLKVVHTREGHEPGLRDCPTCKVRPGSFHLDRCQQIFTPIAYTASQCSKFKTHRGNRGCRPKGQPFTRPGGTVSPCSPALQQTLIFFCDKYA